MNFRNLAISGEIGVQIYGTEQSDRIKPGLPVPGQPHQSDDGDIIYGFGGKDRIKGGAGHDLLFGGAGNDWLGGGKEDDTLIGGVGNDRLKGGAGHDVFRFDSEPGRDIIKDFRDGFDLIAVSSDMFSSQEELESHLHKVHGGVLLEVGDSQLFVKGADLASLRDGDDFLFV